MNKNKNKNKNGSTFFARGKKYYNYPANSTIQRLKAAGYKQIVWQNGDFIVL